MGAEYCNEHVCLSVCLHAYRRNQTAIRDYLSYIILHLRTSPNYLISVHVVCGRGSVLLWRRFDMLSTSGFVNKGMFPMMSASHDAIPAASQPRWIVVHGLTLLLRGICCCFLFQTTAGAKTRRVLRARGAGAEYAMYHCLVFGWLWPARRYAICYGSVSVMCLSVCLSQVHVPSIKMFEQISIRCLA